MKNETKKITTSNKNCPVAINPAMTICFLLALLFSVNMYAITDVLKIRIEKGSYSDETIIRFLDGATEGFDGAYDAWKLFSTNTAVPNLFTRSSSVDEHAINALPSFINSRKIDVYIRIGVAGYYLISGGEVGLFAPGAGIVMKDNVTGQLYDLRSNNTYLINLPVIAETDPPRFTVTFIAPAAMYAAGTSCNTCNDGKLMVKKSGYANWQYTLKNGTGNIITSGIAAIDSVTVSGLAAGTYTLTINTVYGVTELLPVIINQPSATGVASYSILTDINIWSAGSNFMIETDFKSNTDLSLDVFDLSGRMISHLEFNNIQTWRQELVLPEISSGLYVLVAHAGDKILTKKLIKTN